MIACRFSFCQQGPKFDDWDLEDTRACFMTNPPRMWCLGEEDDIKRCPFWKRQEVVHG